MFAIKVGDMNLVPNSHVVKEPIFKLLFDLIYVLWHAHMNVHAHQLPTQEV